MKITFFTRMKICMAVIIGIMLLNRIGVQLPEAAAERLGLERDYTADEIREALSGAYHDAEAVMSQKLDGVFEEPYVSSGKLDDAGAGGAGAAGEG